MNYTSIFSVDRYHNHGNGTVTDKVTGLMWKKCSEGQVWDGNTCLGFATEMTLNQAVWENRAIWQVILGVKRKPKVWDEFAGYGDWRLPSVKELHSILLDDPHTPCINTKIFPNTPSLWFWTMPTNATLTQARLVSFCGGYVNDSYRDIHHAVRLVRKEKT